MSTDPKFLSRMEIAKHNRDLEQAHADADDILCEALIDAGHEDLVDLYTSIERWYA
jgi:hypothetical protein